jgi:SAM-dependent methyltransferase
LVTLKEWRLEVDKPERFLAQLQGALALGAELKPDPLTIEIEFGGDSPAYRRAAADLTALWEKLKGDSSIALKRQIWSDLLRLVYGRDIESEALWIQHTFLVIVAKAIASAVLGLDTDDPHELLSGDRFFRAGIDGAVESDFFDWVLADEEGQAVVRRLLHQVARFRLSDVESDVLKVLYESLIDRAERHGLGEYYTPDWLAAKIVRAAVDQPTTQSVIDPACGSGTFLFHAVRRFLDAAEAAGFPEAERAARATAQVAGIDIHPVATIIARVTYLLALAPALPARAGRITIPVYVGDALQLSKQRILIGNELVITVPPPASLEPRGRVAVGERMLKFPESVCEDPQLLDRVVQRMHVDSENRRPVEHFRAAVRGLGVTDATALSELSDTYETYDELRQTGRNSIWSYVARNLSRPLYLSADQRKADVIVGNPPWLAFRHMSRDLQTRFREIVRGERIYVGGRFATQADLSALFFVRSAALYLKPGGRIAFVMPLAALTRGQFQAFRKGSYESGKIRFEEPWVLDDDVQPLFPVPACVNFGVRHPAFGKAMPETARGLPRRAALARCAGGGGRPASDSGRGGGPQRQYRPLRGRLGLSQRLPPGRHARAAHAVPGGAVEELLER